MSRRSFDFQWEGSPLPPPREMRADEPFRIAVLGDFSGRASRGLCEPESLHERPLIAVDVDNFEEVLARLRPEVHVPLSSTGEGVSVSIQNLDDFHPDWLYGRLEILSELRASRRRLRDPAQLPAEAARLRRAASAETDEQPDSAPAWTGPLGDLLNQALEQVPGAQAAADGFPSVKIAGFDLARLVEEAVAPFVLPKADPRQAEFVAAVEAGIADVMRRVLHAAAFQSVEAAWRQLWRVTQKLTASGNVRLFLLDVTREEIVEDMVVRPNISQAGLFRVLVEQHWVATDRQPWSTLVLLQRVGRSHEDVCLVGGMGALALLSRCPLLADADPDVVGLASWTDGTDPADWKLDDKTAEHRWTDLRIKPWARPIALAAPRPLVRLPYGPTNAIERFVLDELGPTRPHASLLWGSAALACAELLGSSFLQSGWSMRPGELRDLEDLPPCLYEELGEKLLQPSAEVFLTERVGEALAKRGVTPLQSYKNRHAIRVQEFISLAEPATGLIGPWQ